MNFSLQLIATADCADGSDEPVGCVDSTLKLPARCKGDQCNNSMNTTAVCAAPEFYRCGMIVFDFLINAL